MEEISKYDYNLSGQSSKPEKENKNCNIESLVYKCINDGSTATYKLITISKALDSYITIVDKLDNIRDYYKTELHETLSYALEQISAFTSYIFADEFEQYKKEKGMYNEDKNH